jgi:hypothetical protein
VLHTDSWRLERPPEQPRSERLSAAEVSLVLSALAVAVSGGTLLVTYKLGVRRFDHERELDERGDARLTLAAGALELDRMESAQGEVFGSLGVVNTSDFSAHRKKLDQAAEALKAALAGVRIRFQQESDVVLELEAALAITQRLMLTYAVVMGSRLGGGERLEPQEFYESDEVQELIMDFGKHRNLYLAAAQKVVGVGL